MENAHAQSEDIGSEGSQLPPDQSRALNGTVSQMEGASIGSSAWSPRRLSTRRLQTRPKVLVASAACADSNRLNKTSLSCFLFEAHGCAKDAFCLQV